MDSLIISKIKAGLLARLQDNDVRFLQRVYATCPEQYEKRLLAIDFTNLDCVLDAGCGFGQWAIALSKINKIVYALDISQERLLVAEEISDHMRIKNAHYQKGEIEALPYKTNSFDGIFCYSAIYLTDYRKSIREFSRILKPGGRLYLCTNGFGWCLYNLLKKHNQSTDFNPRIYAFRTFISSAIYFLTGFHAKGTSLIMSPNHTAHILRENGFRILGLANEGEINLHSESKITPFFTPYFAKFNYVFEILAEKFDNSHLSTICSEEK